MGDFEGSIGERVAVRFAALGDATRLKLVCELAERGETSVQDLAESIGAPMPNVSKHLQVLFHATLATRRREGTRVYYHLTDPVICRMCKDMRELVEQGSRAPLH